MYLKPGMAAFLVLMAVASSLFWRIWLMPTAHDEAAFSLGMIFTAAGCLILIAALRLERALSPLPARVTPR